MAIYKINQEIIILPFQYLEETGAEARHDSKADALAVNERGKPKTEYASVNRAEGRLLYENTTDFNKLTDDDKRKAFYVSDINALSKYTKSGAVEKIDYGTKQ